MKLFSIEETDTDGFRVKLKVFNIDDDFYKLLTSTLANLKFLMAAQVVKEDTRDFKE